jgi:signal transduction histidine kinase
MLETTESPGSHSTENTRLHGRWLVLARVVWVALVVFALSTFVLSLPAYVAQLQTVCAGVTCVYSYGRLTPGTAHALQNLGLSIGGYAVSILALITASTLVSFGVAGLIFWRRSDDWMAMLVSLFLVTFGANFSAQGLLAANQQTAWVVPLTILTVLGYISLCLLLYLFPDGQFVPRWTRPLAVFVVASNIFLNAYPDAFSRLPPWVIGAIFLVNGGSGVIAQIYRYARVSGPVQRQQTKWVVFGFSATMLVILGRLVPILFFPSLSSSSSLYFLLSTYVYPVGLVLIPLTLGIAILRYRLWDIDILINRTLVYGTLTTCVVALYVLVVIGLGALLQSSGNLLISLLATGLVAVLFQPLRERLQRAVNRLMYGERDMPYRVISRLGQRLEATLAPNEVLPTIVETVAQALKLPYVAITLKQRGELVRAASYGVPKDSLTHLPLVYQNEQMGELLLAPRASGETFTPADHALLDDLARQTGVAAHAVRLTTELQRLTGELQTSRTQLVTTQEEERRRLRRDLHDGLGSALTSMTFQLDAASNVLDRDPQAVKILLKDLKLQAQASITDIRRLVYNLRPPILDEWGLVAAVREQVAQYQLNNVRVTVDAPESLPALPAAVEVAAYRIALEALANVIRHANASTCAICLALCEDALTVEVRDDGSGLPSSFHAGVGINAMRERAAELGGSCVVETITNGGTRVSARLPLLKE